MKEARVAEFETESTTTVIVIEYSDSASLPKEILDHKK